MKVRQGVLCRAVRQQGSGTLEPINIFDELTVNRFPMIDEEVSLLLEIQRELGKPTGPILVRMFDPNGTQVSDSGLIDLSQQMAAPGLTHAVVAADFTVTFAAPGLYRVEVRSGVDLVWKKSFPVALDKA